MCIYIYGVAQIKEFVGGRWRRRSGDAADCRRGTQRRPRRPGCCCAYRGYDRYDNRTKKYENAAVIVERNIAVWKNCRRGRARAHVTRERDGRTRARVDRRDRAREKPPPRSRLRRVADQRRRRLLRRGGGQQITTGTTTSAGRHLVPFPDGPTRTAVLF